MTITEELVRRIRAFEFEDVGPEALVTTRHVFIDGFAVMLAGATEPLGVGTTIRSYTREMAGSPQASVIAGGFKTSMTEAAFANGTMGHALDFDNCWYPLNHPTSPTLPVIMAAAEHFGFSGRECVTALVVAFETQARLRLASTGLHTGRGFHKPGTTGLMGAVAAAVKLLDLTEEQALMAFGIAGSRLGSLSLNTGTMTKATHSGNAARLGLESALLASRGWTGTRDVFGPGGYFDTLLGDEQQPELLIRDFADPLWMVTPGVGFKKYPSNFFTQRPIDAALAIRSRTPLNVEDIESVKIIFPDLHYVDRPRPTSGLDGKFSLQYTTAVALIDGEVTVDSFTDERRFGADVEALLPKMSIEFDPSISNEFLDLHTEVVVRLADGRELSERIDALTGMPGVPLSDEQITSKYYSCATRVLDHDTAQRLLELLDKVETLPDIRGVMELARTPETVA
jgi:2-methylcitrate dehydratase PrpD